MKTPGVFSSVLGFGQAIVLLLVVGCESSGSDESSMRARQDAAMKDPFSYGPAEHDPKKAPAEPVEKDLNKKDTVKSDWDRFWNP